MQTLYRWHCPKCGKKYVNGEEPTFCEEQLSLHAPGNPAADAATGLVSVKCGAPILPLTPPEAERSETAGVDGRIACGPGELFASEDDAALDGPIMTTVISAIRSRNWSFAPYPKWSMVQFTLSCKESVVSMMAYAREKEQQLIVSAMMGPKVPEARRPAVAEFIARVNYHYFIGGFDLDFRDGEVRFRAGIDLEGGELTEKMVDTLFRQTSIAADAHYERLMRVIYGGEDPKAVLEAEAKD